MLLFTFPFYHLCYLSFYILLFFAYLILLLSFPIKCLRDKRKIRGEMQERRKIYFPPSTFLSLMTFHCSLFFQYLIFLFLSLSYDFLFPFLSLSSLLLSIFFTFLRGKKIEMGAKSKKKKHRKKERNSYIN